MEKDETTTQRAFVFQPSFWNAINELDDDAQKREILFALVHYGIEGTADFDKLAPFARCVMKLIMPTIDKQQEVYDRKKQAGKQGGRPKNQEKADDNQDESREDFRFSDEKADDNQDESRNSRRLGKEKEKDIFFNKDIENEKDIVFLKEKETENATEVSDDKNKKTDLNFSEIKKYFVGKGFDESTAQRFIDYNINHNKKVPNDWKHYADKWIENEKNEKQKTTPPIDRTAPPNPETKPIQGKGYIFDTIQQKNWDHNLFDPNPIGKDPYGRQLYKLKTA